MPKKRHSAEQIIAKLREAEVEIAKGHHRPQSPPQDRRHRADLLPLAQGVRRPAGRPGQAAEGAGEGERPAEEAGGRPQASTTRSSRRSHGETSEPGQAAPGGRACREQLLRLRAAGLPGPGPAALDAAARAEGARRRAAPGGEDHRAGQQVWPLRLPPDHGVAAPGGLAGESQAGRAALATGGAEGAEEAAQAGPAVAQ